MQPGDMPATYASIDRLRAAVGFAPRTPLADGLARFVAWYRELFRRVARRRGGRTGKIARSQPDRPSRPSMRTPHMILVTGGAGFIGANFVLDWLAATRRAGRQSRQAHLRGQPRQPAVRSRSDDRHVFVRGDIGDRALVGALLREHRPRAIVNFAAESHVDRSIHGPAAFIETNVVGTFNLLDADARVVGGAAAGRTRGASASCTCRPTRSTARSAATDPAFSETTAVRAEQPVLGVEGRRPITWCAPITTRTGCRR